MTYDHKIAKLFLMNFDEAYRTAKLLMLSHERLKGISPISGKSMEDLIVDDLDRLDTFCVRFGNFLDVIGTKIFRSILLLEENELGSQPDIINKMEKRGIISSFEERKKIRALRNLFTHDYPDSKDTKNCFEQTAQIWLFGSRTDMTKRGGNIDLYIETDLENKTVEAKLKKRSSIWPVFGDQKIDVLIRRRSDEMNPMHEHAKESGIKLP